MKVPKWKVVLCSLLLIFVGASFPIARHVLAQTVNSVQIANANFNSNVPTPGAGYIATAWASSGLNVISEYQPAQGVINSIPYSTTPAINVSQGGIAQFKCTTSGAAISPTFSGFTAGLKFDLIFVQNGTTACTLTYPANLHGGTTVGTTLNGVNIQEFVVSANGTDAYAVAAAATNTTGGTP